MYIRIRKKETTINWNVQTKFHIVKFNESSNRTRSNCKYLFNWKSRATRKKSTLISRRPQIFYTNFYTLITKIKAIIFVLTF